MPHATLARTFGELKASGYEPLTIRQEVHRNLVRQIEEGVNLFPEIIGYSNTVMPEVENALLAGQDIVVLGERGQAKSRLIRSMTRLLDEQVPMVAGCEINDDPYGPICRSCRDRLAEDGEALPIDWLARENRYGEKLATPDVSMADLVGDIDPIKVAEGRYLSSELTIHYGLVPRTNRGIFCINELPDLAERIQVGLFNLMEERDIQIRGYRVRLPLDMLIFATANPEDYTNRGRIITPLKDRYGAQVRTHYPLNTADELAIVDQERTRLTNGQDRVRFPDYMAEIVSEITAMARRDPEINQRSGVSVRVSIANYETLHSAALRRALRHGEKIASPRITDLPAILASMRGKIELESIEEGREAKLIEEIADRAIMAVFERRFQPDEMGHAAAAFERGVSVVTGSDRPSSEYIEAADKAGLQPMLARLGNLESPAETAAAIEFVLEGLHLVQRLNRDRVPGGFAYTWGAAPAAGAMDPTLRRRDLYGRRRYRGS